MFPESSTWGADIVRVTVDGGADPDRRAVGGVPLGGAGADSWPRYPGVRHHADAGLDNQLAFLDAALDWVANNTPRDRQTLYLEATVRSWHNDDADPGPCSGAVREDAG